MLVRTYIYCHVAPASLTGLASYWDRYGLPSGPIRHLYAIGIMAVYSLPILLAVLIFILWSPKIDAREKLFALVAGALATIGQIIAFSPLIQ